LHRGKKNVFLLVDGAICGTMATICSDSCR